MSPASADPFDDLLTLEDTLYTTAHDQGVADGARAGRIEGRIFGLEKGFEKFSALGELHGRGAVWGSRLARRVKNPATTTEPTTSTTTAGSAHTPLPPLANPSSRLLSNTSLLYHLTDPLTFSTANTEAGVEDFDDRFKRAGAKAKVIERIVGENAPGKDAKSPERGGGAAKARNVRLESDGGGKKGGKKGDDSMEDFGGSRLIR
ncbi:hypothetical protein C7974DRAFT_138738 [Boeremia exigua]|uniref:uncharacterized protein n=1 Tax=Boeremia exigua TaxID=749465 RepID=UPI001E8EB728|nr:uncharacterized protein C7974DRAFT_138738 [Boeremia exigua]KAH6639775.1 hypothetical protein C7974DRAFT_138738 [Boeremia exigua]